MATTKRLIKDLRDKKNIDIIQVLKSFIYDDRQLSVYKEGVTYKKRDIVINFDATSNRFKTYRCIVNKSSSTWDASQWQVENAISTIFKMEDKLIIHSNTQPTDVENKLWFQDLKSNTDGSINVLTKIKNSEGQYETIYTAGITDNVYMDHTRAKTLTSKINDMDVERTRIRSLYLMDMMDLLLDLGAITPNEKTLNFINVLDVSNNDDVTISGGATRYSGVISI